MIDVLKELQKQLKCLENSCKSLEDSIEYLKNKSNNECDTYNIRDIMFNYAPIVDFTHCMYYNGIGYIFKYDKKLDLFVFTKAFINNKKIEIFIPISRKAMTDEMLSYVFKNTSKKLEEKGIYKE